MLMSLIATMCVLAIVVVGLLVVTQTISLEGLVHGIWRGFVLVVLAVAAVWLLRTGLLPILICALVALKQAMLGALLIVLEVIAFGLLLWAGAHWSAKGNGRGSRQ